MHSPPCKCSTLARSHITHARGAGDRGARSARCSRRQQRLSLQLCSESACIQRPPLQLPYAARCGSARRRRRLPSRRRARCGCRGVRCQWSPPGPLARCCRGSRKLVYVSSSRGCSSSYSVHTSAVCSVRLITCAWVRGRCCSRTQDTAGETLTPAAPALTPGRAKTPAPVRIEAQQPH